MHKVGMKTRRERHGNQRAIATFATCNACGAPFTSGRIQVEVRYVSRPSAMTAFATARKRYTL
jgi:hypothetical protein